MKKIAVLTYTEKHRKTYDVLCLLKANGYIDVEIYAVPFHYEKKKYPLYEHRPEMNYSVPDTKGICKNFDYTYIEGQLDAFEIEQDRIVIIAGAGILPDSFIKSHTVINSHPGFIPNCRGLDALKWAIIENQPIGVTSHLIGDYVDAGEIIERRLVDVYENDTFHSLSERVYENEVSMLVEAIEKTSNTECVYPKDFQLHKRMPETIEQNLLVEFETYKKFHGIKRRR